MNVSYYHLAQSHPYLSLALARRGGRLDVALEDPRVVRDDFLVVVLEHADLFEAVPLVEAFRVRVGDLDMEIDRGDPWPRVSRGGVEKMLQTLRSNAPRTIRLRDGHRHRRDSRCVV